MVVYSNMRNIKPVLTIGVSFDARLKSLCVFYHIDEGGLGESGPPVSLKMGNLTRYIIPLIIIANATMKIIIAPRTRTIDKVGILSQPSILLIFFPNIVPDPYVWGGLNPMLIRNAAIVSRM